MTFIDFEGYFCGKKIFLTPTARKIHSVAHVNYDTSICLHMNRKAYVAYDFNCLSKIKVQGHKQSHTL